MVLQDEFLNVKRKGRDMKRNKEEKLKKKNKGMKFETVSSVQMWSMCIIPMLFVFFFSYMPMAGLVLAFKDFKYAKGIFGSPWIGLSNFKIFLLSNDFAKVAWNTISLNLIFMFVSTVCQVAVAVLLYEVVSRRATKTYQTLMITPHFVSWVIAGYMAFAFLNPNGGLINTALSKIGIDAVNWYGESKYWPFILSICYVWKGLGMNSVIYYAALMGIDSTLFEAAEIDGANKFKIAWHIIIPQLMTIIIILQILGIGNIFRADFGLFYNIPRNVGALYDTTDVMDTWIFRTMREVGDMSVSSAAGLIQSVVGFVLVMLTNYITKKIDPERALF